MLQVIDGKLVEVVEFDTVPETPITGLTDAEATYELALSRARGYISPLYDRKCRTTGRYAQALTKAIDDGVIAGPGKYGIHLNGDRYDVFKIIEE